MLFPAGNALETWAWDHLQLAEPRFSCGPGPYLCSRGACPPEGAGARAGGLVLGVGRQRFSVSGCGQGPLSLGSWGAGGPYDDEAMRQPHLCSLDSGGREGFGGHHPLSKEAWTCGSARLSQGPCCPASSSAFLQLRAWPLLPLPPGAPSEAPGPHQALGWGRKERTVLAQGGLASVVRGQVARGGPQALGRPWTGTCARAGAVQHVWMHDYVCPVVPVSRT